MSLLCVPWARSFVAFFGKSQDNCSNYEYEEDTRYLAAARPAVRASGLVPGFCLQWSSDDCCVRTWTTTDTQLFIYTASSVKCLTAHWGDSISWNGLSQVAARNCGSFLPADRDRSHWHLEKWRRNSFVWGLNVLQRVKCWEHNATLSTNERTDGRTGERTTCSRDIQHKVPVPQPANCTPHLAILWSFIIVFTDLPLDLDLSHTKPISPPPLPVCLRWI